MVLALFTITQVWIQLSAHQQVNRSRNMCEYTVQYYSPIKKKGTLPFVTTWVNLEGIMLSKITQTEEDMVYCMVSLIYGI